MTLEDCGYHLAKIPTEELEEYSSYNGAVTIKFMKTGIKQVRKYYDIPLNEESERDIGYSPKEIEAIYDIMKRKGWI